ncbi:MAG: hypothetical protein HC831_31745 [Chloroflexia bacterium]|nr:hypothetical protein [Chloroflexia bacterium]
MVISKVYHEQEVYAISNETKFFVGDIIRVIGSMEAIERAKLLIGNEIDLNSQLQEVQKRSGF